MRYAFIFLILIFVMPFSSASIDILSQLKGECNLGDNIDFSFKIVPGRTTSALVKLTLKCTNKEVIYYTAPISLKKGEEITVEAPSIEAFSEGLCNIRANIKSLEGEDLEGITSKEFTISHLLGLSVTADKTEVLPGDKVKIKGSADKGGGIIEDGSIVVRLDNKQGQVELDRRDFSYELELDKDIKSGEHTIFVELNDSYGNYNEEGIKINVEAVPAALGFSVNRNEFNPKETLELKVDLLDQAGDIIEDNVDVKLFRKKTLFKDEIVIFDTQTDPNKEFDFTFDYSTPPYDYTLRITFGDLEKEEAITILPHLKIEMEVEENSIIIRNVGNVNYNNYTTILLEKEDKKYIINKKIKLDVGEETRLDLSKEVPSGSYTVTLPPETVTKERIVEKTVEKIIETEVPNYIGKEVAKSEGKVVENEEEGANVIGNVEIEDNRPLYKKGLNWITGKVIVGTGLLLSRPKSASFIMVIIILSLIGYFNRGRIGKIMEKIKEKREKF